MQEAVRRKVQISLTNGQVKGAFFYRDWHTAMRDFLFLAACFGFGWHAHTTSSQLDVMKAELDTSRVQLSECRKETNFLTQQLITLTGPPTNTVPRTRVLGLTDAR